MQIVFHARMKAAIRIFRAAKIKVDASKLSRVKDDSLKLSGYSCLLGIPIPNNGFYDGNVPLVKYSL